MISPEVAKVVNDVGSKIKEEQKNPDVVGNHTKLLITNLEESANNTE